MTSEQRKPLKLSKLCQILRRRSTDKKKDANVMHVDGKLGHDSSECKSIIKDKTTADKNGTKVSCCHSCFQKVFPNEGCLCSDPVEVILNEEGSSQILANDVFPKEAYDLLAKLLAIDPEKRLTAEIALRHPFFEMNLSS